MTRIAQKTNHSLLTFTWPVKGNGWVDTVLILEEVSSTQSPWLGEGYIILTPDDLSLSLHRAFTYTDR